MHVPRRSLITSIAREAFVENPETISGFDLKRKLVEMAPENWAGIDRDALLSRLDDVLDGACPLF